MYRDSRKHSKRSLTKDLRRITIPVNNDGYRIAIEFRLNLAFSLAYFIIYLSVFLIKKNTFSFETNGTKKNLVFLLDGD